MPYASNEQLPQPLRRHLPPHAQDIYREAFNHAWETYAHREALAHRVAWAAVKRRFTKSNGDWVPRASVSGP